MYIQQVHDLLELSVTYYLRGKFGTDEFDVLVSYDAVRMWYEINVSPHRVDSNGRRANLHMVYSDAYLPEDGKFNLVIPDHFIAELALVGL